MTFYLFILSLGSAPDHHTVDVYVMCLRSHPVLKLDLIAVTHACLCQLTRLMKIKSLLKSAILHCIKPPGMALLLSETYF